MPTAADLIERTRWHLMTGVYEERNALAGPVSDTDTTWTLLYPLRSIREGAVLAVGLELVVVMAVSEGAGTATVSRGFAGSTAAAHTTSALVAVNPRFSDFHVLAALNDELRSLSSLGLYQVGSLSIAYDGTVSTYDLADDVIDVLDVRYDATSLRRSWPSVGDFQLLRDMDTADYPSGMAIRFDGRVQADTDVLVRYKKAFGMLSALTDDVEAVTGLWNEALDIPPLGAAVTLASARDIRRTDTIAQGDTRRANEVPAGTPQGAVRTLSQRYAFRIGQEQARLYQRYPLVRA